MIPEAEVAVHIRRTLYKTRELYRGVEIQYIVIHPSLWHRYVKGNHETDVTTRYGRIMGIPVLRSMDLKEDEIIPIPKSYGN